MNVIEVNGLSKSYAYYTKEVGLGSSIKNLFHRKTLVREAVKNVSFQISQGEVVAFLGPNGAGKTTTLKMLSGILHPTAGEASVLGFKPWERKDAFKRQFSIVMGQKNQLWTDLPANESIYLNKCIYQIDDLEYRKTLDELTELLDVKELLGVQVRRLSLGERMKMEIIAALIHKPKLLFLDEPTIGLDLVSQQKVRHFLDYYNRQTGATILLTSHYMKDIEDLCKRTIIINEGSVLYDGELNQVNALFQEKKIMKVTFTQPVPEEELARYGIVKRHEHRYAVLEIAKSNVREASQDMLLRFPVEDFNMENVPLEEGIALLYEKRTADSHAQ